MEDDNGCNEARCDDRKDSHDVPPSMSVGYRAKIGWVRITAYGIVDGEDVHDERDGGKPARRSRAWLVSSERCRDGTVPPVAAVEE